MTPNRIRSKDDPARFKMIKASEMKPDTRADVVDGVIAPYGSSLIHGKNIDVVRQVAGQLAIAVATGTEWFGRETGRKRTLVRSHNWDWVTKLEDSNRDFLKAHDATRPQFD